MEWFRRILSHAVFKTSKYLQTFFNIYQQNRMAEIAGNPESQNKVKIPHSSYLAQNSKFFMASIASESPMQPFGLNAIKALSSCSYIHFVHSELLFVIFFFKIKFAFNRKPKSPAIKSFSVCD